MRLDALFLFVLLGDRLLRMLPVHGRRVWASRILVGLRVDAPPIEMVKEGYADIFRAPVILLTGLKPILDWMACVR